MSTETTSIRQLVRKTSTEDLVANHTKAELVEMAQTAGIEEPKGTKADIVAAIQERYPPPDPSLRGKSSISNPVREVFLFCDEHVAGAKDGERPGRTKAIQMMVELGIAFFTARTQYQVWFSHTERGTLRLSQIDITSLPKSVREALADD